MRRIYVPLGIVLLLTLAVAVPALAQDALPPDPTAGDPLALIQTLLGYIAAGNWKGLGFVAVIGLMWLLRKGGAKIIPWFATDAGGSILSMVTGVVLAVAYALQTGHAFSFPLLFGGIAFSWTLSGGYAHWKKVGWPALVWLAGKVGLKLPADPPADPPAAPSAPTP